MIIIVIYVIISFLLDGLISNFINPDIANPSYLKTIYSLVALVISYNYFDNEKKYLKILLILGILFDIVYTNTFLLNIFIFIVIYFILRFLNIYINNNLITINLKTILAIIIYHSLSYLILLLTNYHHYPLKLLLLVILGSIIMTIIYTTISHLFIKKIYYQKYSKKIK